MTADYVFTVIFSVVFISLIIAICIYGGPDEMKGYEK